MKPQHHTVKLLAGICLLVMAMVLFAEIAPYISKDHLESHFGDYLQYYAISPITVMIFYLVVSTLLIGAALPVTGVCSLFAGALFGFELGWALGTISSTVGATIVFFWSRYLFRDWLKSRFEKQFSSVSEGIDEEGLYYLFSIRLLVIFPFFLVNILCGLTNLKPSMYMLVTTFAQIFIIALFAYAGSTMASFGSSKEILSIEVVCALTLLGFAPLAFHRLLNWFKFRCRAGD